MSIACCKLYCGQRSQLLQNQCQGILERMAILTWFMVVVLVLCALIQLVSVFLERGARKVAIVRVPLFLAFISVIVYVVTDDHFYSHTPFYPIVGALNVAVFSYFFSSFQYSISLAYELTAAIALIFTMFPIWTVLTVKIETLIGAEVDGRVGYDQTIRTIVGLVLAMLISSLLWIIHSSLYRTVGYRAAWFTAFQESLPAEEENQPLSRK